MPIYNVGKNCCLIITSQKFAKSLKMGGNKNLRSLQRELGQKATQAAAREATSPPPILNVPSFPSNLNKYLLLMGFDEIYVKCKKWRTDSHIFKKVSTSTCFLWLTNFI